MMLDARTTHKHTNRGIKGQCLLLGRFERTDQTRTRGDTGNRKKQNKRNEAHRDTVGVDLVGHFAHGKTMQTAVIKAFRALCNSQQKSRKTIKEHKRAHKHHRRGNAKICQGGARGARSWKTLRNQPIVRAAD